MISPPELLRATAMPGKNKSAGGSLISLDETAVGV
jgi:hypothetical protein